MTTTVFFMPCYHSAATQTIQEISSLHAQLSSHLSAQQESINMIRQDAETATADMQSANMYLLGAESAFADGKKFMLVFLICASLCLLFLDWFYV